MDAIAVALGGNALLQKGERPSFHLQMKNVAETARRLAAEMAKSRNGFVITHGNGPQVGDEFLRNFYAKEKIPKLPMHALNAETQAMIGSMLELELGNELRRLGSRKRVSTVLTHVIVDAKDPAFENPTKPIGPFYSKAHLKRELKVEKFHYAKIDGCYRRVVPSPRPLEIVELAEIDALARKGDIVICCGGGGIPVFRNGKALIGAEAVVDKDSTTRLLSNSIGMRRMVILTNVDYVYEDHEAKKGEIRRASARSLARRISDFEDGTMKPKIEACIEFINNGGELAQIGNLEKFGNVMAKQSGTEIRQL